MKKMVAVIASSVLIGSLAVAAGKRADKTEYENAQGGKEVHEIDTIKNPITGTTTTTETYKNTMEGQHGKSKIEIEDKTKRTRGGKVTKETDIEAKSVSE